MKQQKFFVIVITVCALLLSLAGCASSSAFDGSIHVDVERTPEAVEPDGTQEPEAEVLTMTAEDLVGPWHLAEVIETQASRISEQEALIKDLQETVAELRSLKANLEETLEEFRRQLFGTKSEKTREVNKTADKDEGKKPVRVKAHDRKPKAKATRDELYADLPVREIIYPVPEEERHCDWCNAEMIPVTHKFVREEIRITPAVVERIRYMQEVLICPECHKDHDGSFKEGPVPKALIPHSPASASAVAYVMFSKVFMGLPYYRMESGFSQLGATIPRETMANWCILCSQRYLLPIYVRLHAELLKRDVIHADELWKASHNSSIFGKIYSAKYFAHDLSRIFFSLSV